MNEAGGDLLGIEALHSPCLVTSDMTQTHCQGHLHGNLEMQLAMILLPKQGTQKSCDVAHQPCYRTLLVAG